jgi:hypothetical protein
MTRAPARLLLATALLSAVAGAGVVLAPAAGAENGGRPLFAALSGTAEVPGPGDADGSGTAALRVNVGQAEVCFDLAVNGIASATAAHIHEGSSIESGPVVVGLTAPTGGTSTGCRSVSRELATELLRSPQDYYVNVHNDEFTAGAVRGQLGK